MSIFRSALVGLLIAASSSLAATSQCATSTCAIENYIAPYVQTNNFSGVVLAARAGVPVFAEAYGLADRERRIPNSLKTRFHIASMSMQFTAAAALRLIEEGKLSLDTPVSDVVPEFPNGGQIAVRHLLTETSGIADINAQSDYAEVLTKHQTPLSLVKHVQNLPPLREPGTFDREEHSAYNLLALIIERKTDLPFAEAVRKLVFQPLGMNDSGIDDDSPANLRNAAKGYQPTGVYGIEPAAPIHWSAKAGNASAYSTTADELKFVRGMLGEKFLSARLRNIVFDMASRVGYGWFKSKSERFGQAVYSMNGRSPGFSSAEAYLTQDRLLVVVLSSLYNSAPSDVSLDVAAMLSWRPYRRLTLKTVVDPETLAGMPASFQFQKDFYQPSALLHLHAIDGQVSLDWPSGTRSALIPTSKDHFMDRNYWVPVDIVRGPAGQIQQLKYDRFTGQRVKN
ncbi:MAG TPA: serine hydrolase domain-containing protein [Sphingomicrobium sp.]|nr:serine hydrolase domain-containing protein [Sphingomicrobium sp.]